jgi:hypothetical protein
LFYFFNKKLNNLLGRFTKPSLFFENNIMGLGPAPEISAELSPKESTKSMKSKYYINQLSYRQCGVLFLVGFIALVTVILLVLSSNETAQMSNMKDELLNIERQLEEQNNRSPNANGPPLPTNALKQAPVYYTDARFANTTETLLLNHDFSIDTVEHNNLISNRWVCNDDEGIVASGIKINSFRYKRPVTADDLLCENTDNIKFFCASRNLFAITNNTKGIEIQAILSGEVYCTANRNVACANDPRVASVLFSTWDDESQTQNDILLTNTTIYAMHSKRLPVRRKDKFGDFSTQSYMFPIHARKNAAQIHKVAIIYVQDELGFWNVVFKVDDRERLTLFRLGRSQQHSFMTFRQGSSFAEVDIAPKRISVGFGTASFMQMKFPGLETSLPYYTLPCNLIKNNETESLYGEALRSNGTNSFLQGAKLSIVSINIKEYQQKNNKA